MVARVTLGVLFLAGLPFVQPLSAGISSAHLGDQIALSGILISLGGFAITVWQLTLTRRASDAATDAVADLRFRLQAFEAAALCRECLSAGNEIERLIGIANVWPDPYVLAPLLERFRSLRISLSTLRAHQEKKWTDDQLRVVQAAVTNCVDADKAILKHTSRPTTKPPQLDPSRIAVQDLTSMLAMLAVSLGEAATGEENGY